MEKQNKKIFLAILYCTLLVVALVWLATAPERDKTPTKPAPVTALVAPTAPTAPKPPAAPTPITTDMGIPALRVEKKIHALTMPDIAPSAPKRDHVDPRIAATVLTSGDGFDRLVNGAISLFVYVMTH